MRTRSLGFALFFATLALLGGASHAETPVSGTITTSAWTSSNSPYRVTGTVTIPAGNTLTIDPGVDVLFNADVQFIVQGSLQVNGAEGAPVTFAKGTAAEWGGIRLTAGGTATIEWAEISGGTAEGAAPNNKGGAIYVGPYSSLACTHVTFTGNKAIGSGYGGAVALDNGFLASLFSFCTFTQNGDQSGGYATSYGGALYVGNSFNNVTVEDCVFSGNRGNEGGAIYAAGSGSNLPTVTIRNSKFSGNRTWGAGGAVKVSQLTKLTVENSEFSGNIQGDGSATGGAIEIANTPATITDCVIRGNQSYLGGAGIAVRGSASFVGLIRVVFDGNTAQWDNGGGVLASNMASVSLNKCTVVNNGAYSTGGGVYVDGGANVGIINSIVYGNTPNQLAANAPGQFNAVTYSNVQGGWAGDGNIDQLPAFLSTTPDDPGYYRLALNSPCIDAGDPNSERDPDGTVADIGAFFFDKRVDEYHVGGAIADGTTWSGDPDNPVRVVGMVTVPEGATLNIAAGTDVLFDADVQIHVEGQLNAVGSEGSHIRFMPGTSPQWGGIRLWAGHNTMEYVEVTGVHVTFDWESWQGDKVARSDAPVARLTREERRARPSNASRLRAARAARPAGTAKVTFTENEYPVGAIALLGGQTRLTMHGCLIHGNTAVYGGGIAVEEGAFLDAANTTISNNSATFQTDELYREGGGVAVYNGRAWFTQCVFTGNFADDDGGAVYVYNDVDQEAISFDRCEFTNNTAGLYGGGAIEFSNGVLRVSGCTFRENSAGEAGGAIDVFDWITSTSGTVTGSTFRGNTAVQGGAVWVGLDAELALEKSLFAGNQAAPNESLEMFDAFGGAVFVQLNGTASVDRCTFSGNSVQPAEFSPRPARTGENGSYGGAIATMGSVNVTSSILWGDTPDEVALLYWETSPSVYVSFSNVQGGWDGPGNINTDPQFLSTDPVSEDYYRLAMTSPCVDGGDPEAERDPDRTRADMGAFPTSYYWQNDPANVKGFVTTATWSVLNSPYRVTGTVLIPEGNTLTIEPGVDVLFNADAALVVYGSLNAVGTSKRVGERIRFLTENPPDTYGYGNGYWGGIRFVNPTAASQLTCVQIKQSRTTDEFWEGGGAISVKNTGATRFGVALDHVDISMCVGGNGGAVFVQNADLTISHSELSYNKAADGGGGALYVAGGMATVSYTAMWANSSDADGAAVYVGSGGSVALQNCTLADNMPGDGSGQVFSVAGGSIVIANSILYGYEHIESYQGATVAVTYSNIRILGDSQFIWAGQGNINVDPLFVEAGPENYNLRLQAGSPCIGAGEDDVDMGAFPFSSSYLYGDLTNLHWTLEESPYRLAGTVTVPEGATLVIDPGVEVLAAADAAIMVEGTITAEGSETAPIIFRPDDDQAQWGGIRITSGTTNTIQWADISGVYAIPGEYGWNKPAAGARPAGEVALIEQLRAANLLPAARERSPRLSKAERKANRAAGTVARAARSAGTGTAPSERAARPAYNTGGYNAPGGALYVEGTDTRLVLANVTVHDNIAFYGAGIYASWNAVVNADNCQIVNNSGLMSGGGLYIDDGASLTATGCEISGNKAFVDLEGGGARLSYSSALFTNCQITGNSGGIGGGVYAYNSSLGIVGGSVSGNVAKPEDDYYEYGGSGGGIYYEAMCDTVSLRVHSCAITGNTGAIGGGLYVEEDYECGDEPVVVLNGCTISNNTATRDYGGGIEAPGGALTITDCVFAGNSSNMEGGAGDLYGASATISGCRFENNIAGGVGGALWIACDAPVEKTVFVGNKAVPRPELGGDYLVCSGGAIMNLGGLSIDRCTFVANEAVQADGVNVLPPGDGFLNRSARTAQYAQFGGAICTEASLTILSSIMWGNAPDEVALAPFSQATLDIMGSNLLGEYDGELWNCISADPMFVDSAGGDFHLRLGSPCVNTGSVNSPLDPDGSPADMGAFYFDLTGYVWGELAGTWTRANSPYRVGAPVSVPYGSTLTIGPGVDVLFDADVPLVVEGTLQALGESGEGNGIRFVPGVAPEWGGLKFIGAINKPSTAGISLAARAARASETGESAVRYAEITGVDADMPISGDYIPFLGVMGGGVMAFGTAVDIANSHIHGNQAMFGGGLGVFEGGLMLNSCVVENNVATAGVGGGFIALYGGVMANETQFRNNTAVDTSGFFEGVGGGGGYVEDSYAVFERCGFRGNTVDGTGGGVMIANDPYNSPPVEFTHCLFAGNTAAAGGGAHATLPYSQGQRLALRLPDSLRVAPAKRPAAPARTQQEPGTTFVNCTFTENSATGIPADVGGLVQPKPAGMAEDPLMVYGSGILADAPFSLSSSVVWGNVPDQIAIGAPPPANRPAGTAALPGVTYSDVQMDEGMIWEGTGNINADPLFVNSAEGDFRLDVYSPCVNTGDPAGAPDPNGTRADMGAFPLEYKTGDVTMDGNITTQDASQVLRYSVKLETSIPFALADVTANERVTALDAAMILFKWLRLSLNEDFTFPLDEGYYNTAKLAIPANPRTLTWERSGPVWELRADNPDGLMAGEFAFTVASDVVLLAEAGEHFAANREGEIIRVAFARLDFASPVLVRLVDDGRLLTPPSIASMELNDGATPILRVVRPVEFALQQNTPNPFNPTTTIRFGLPVEGPVQLVVYDITGRVVRTLVDARMEAGVHAVTWDGRDAVGRDVASGTYVYRLVAPSGVLVKRMVMVK